MEDRGRKRGHQSTAKLGEMEWGSVGGKEGTGSRGL